MDIIWLTALGTPKTVAGLKKYENDNIQTENKKKKQEAWFFKEVAVAKRTQHNKAQTKAGKKEFNGINGAIFKK